MDNKLEVKFKLLFMSEGQLKKTPYLVKFKHFLESIKEVVNSDITQDIVEIQDLEVQLKTFYLDEKNNQTFVAINVLMAFVGPIKETQEDQPKYVERLIEYTEDWLNSFKPYTQKVKVKASGKHKKVESKSKSKPAIAPEGMAHVRNRAYPKAGEQNSL